MDLIRRDTDYAIRGLLYLAQAEDGTVRCAELAEACDIPRTYAHKILRKMTAAGVVESRTGRGGGFWLKRSPKRITLLEVIEAIQGPVSICTCLFSAKVCTRKKGCRLSEEWRELQGEITGFLKQTSVADVLCYHSRAEHAAAGKGT